MSEPGQHTYREILSQPQIWAQVIDGFLPQVERWRQFWAEAAPTHLLFTGCGSAYFAGQTLAFVAWDLLRLPSVAVPASELWLHGEPSIPEGENVRPLVVALSRSGETSETISGVRRYASPHQSASRCSVVAITCNPDSKLARLGDFVLAAEAAQEQSIVQTRSLTSMVLLALGMLAVWAGDERIAAWNDKSLAGFLQSLPAALDRLLAAYHEVICELGEFDQFDRFFYLGTGVYRGFANEAMLKMKEMSFSQSESFHTLEFRHGLGANVTPSSLIVSLVPERGGHSRNVMNDMLTLGAWGLEISEGPLEEEARLRTIALISGLPEWARIVLPLPLLQLLAYYRARKNGLNPDVPANLKSHIVLPELDLQDGLLD